MTNLKPKTYHLILFLALFLLIPAISHATCSSVPLTGDYTVSASCTFPVNSNIGGADNGNITINSGQTLTVNAGETVAWGPGKSLIINGSIAIANGAQLKQGRICRTDADGDGYVTTAAPTVASTCTGKITQSAMNESMINWADIKYDYDDTSAAIYPGTICAGDCSVNDSTGSCVAVSAGENGLAVCTRCNGSSLSHVNTADNTQDAEGSNVCNQTCKNCNGAGSCVSQVSGEDLFTQCTQAYTCSGYATRLRNMCNGAGACAAIDASASDCSGTCAAYCSSGSCISTDTSVGTCTVATNARLASGGDGSCSSGTCVAPVFCSGAAGDHNTTDTVSGDLVYCDNSDRLWTPTANVDGSADTKQWYTSNVNTADSCIGQGASFEACNYCDTLTYAGYSDWELPTCVSGAKDSSCILYQFGIDACGGYSCTPAWDTRAQAGSYWSSTEYQSYTLYAWRVYFNNGDVSSIRKSGNYYVRCVRGQ